MAYWTDERLTLVRSGLRKEPRKLENLKHMLMVGTYQCNSNWKSYFKNSYLTSWRTHTVRQSDHQVSGYNQQQHLQSDETLLGE